MANKRTTDTRTWPWAEAKDLVDATSFFDPPSLFAAAISKTLPLADGNERILDIGCGSGVVGLYCLVFRKADFVTFNDVQVEAIVETYSNVARHVAAKTMRESQAAYVLGGFESIPESIISQHSLLAFNPPQLPTDFVTPQYRSKIKADAANSIFRLAGPDGLAIARQFLHWYARLRIPKPKATILLSSFLGRGRIEEAITSQGLHHDIMCETEVPLREQLVEAAEGFAGNKNEIENRFLSKRGDRWFKKLLTISIEDSNKA